MLHDSARSGVVDAQVARQRCLFGDRAELGSGRQTDRRSGGERQGSGSGSPGYRTGCRPENPAGTSWVPGRAGGQNAIETQGRCASGRPIPGAKRGSGTSWIGRFRRSQRRSCHPRSALANLHEVAHFALPRVGARGLRAVRGRSGGPPKVGASIGRRDRTVADAQSATPAGRGCRDKRRKTGTENEPSDAGEGRAWRH